MALEVPRAFLSDDRPRPRPTEEERSYRLPPAHVQVLRDVARGVEESDVGVCCSYLVDSTSGEGADYDEHALNRLERFCEQSLTFDHLGALFGTAVVASWRSKVQRCRRTIIRLRERGDQHSANVLMVAHGYPDPIVAQLPDLGTFGPLASLVRYTDEVERRRAELARAEAVTTTRRWVPETRMGREWRGVDMSADEIKRDLGDARTQTGSEKARAAMSLGLDARQGNAGVIDLVKHRQRLEWADRSTSSGDALRASLVTFHEPPAVQRPLESHGAFESRKESRKAREQAHKDKRSAFLTQVRIEAMRMLSDAEQRYHGAWLVSR